MIEHAHLRLIGLGYGFALSALLWLLIVGAVLGLP
jgi:hypothetical protein